MVKKIRHTFPALLRIALLAITGCTLAANAQPTPSPTIDTATDWTQIAPGVERRSLLPDENQWAEVITLRIDPAQVTFRVHYQPGEPLALDDWAERLPNALAFVNANFFSTERRALGLLVADGAIYDNRFNRPSGLFSIAAGIPAITATAADRTDAITQAVTGFPVLVRGGEATYQTQGRFSRRTVVALDAEGHVLLMATPLFGLSLADLSTFLAESDLNITEALNLDGGGSTLLWTMGDSRDIRSLDPVPAVLAIYPST
jgi:uncharacterized protein YigE (DUF2233 family)